MLNKIPNKTSIELKLRQICRIPHHSLLNYDILVASFSRARETNQDAARTCRSSDEKRQPTEPTPAINNIDRERRVPGRFFFPP